MTMIRPETEMKDSGVKYIGLIPRTWKIVQLKYCTDCLDGKRVPIDASLRKSGIYPYWGAGRIMDYVDDYIFDERLVLLGEDGAPFFDDFRPVSHLIDGKVWVNNHIHVLRTKDNVVDSYLVHALNSVDYHEYINGSILNKLTQSNMNRIKIPLPSYIEQQAIADYLDETCSKIDEIIAEAKASIDEYKELKQSVIFEAVTKGLDKNVEMKDSGIEWIGDYNAEFGMTRIGRFCFVTKLAGFEYTNAMADSIVNEFGVPIVRAQNVKMFKFYSDKIGEFIPKDISFQLNRSSLNKKCLLITFIGAGIGDVCVFDEKERYHLAPNVAKIEIFDEYKCLLDEHYLMYYLGSEAGQGEIRRISKASAQPSLSMETIRSINVVLPPFDVQEQIVEYLNKKVLHMDSLIAEKESLINDLEAYKKSLIYEVVTGKRKVV